MDARTQAWIDQEHARVAETVRRHGWLIRYVGGGLCSRPGCDCPPMDGPAFAYTVGLFGLAHPELLMFGVPPDTAALVLSTLGRRIRAGEGLLPGRMVTVDGWPRRIMPEAVPNPEEITFDANDYYQRPLGYPVPVLQLSYDDAAGRFPWEEGYEAPESQPRPGTFKA